LFSILFSDFEEVMSVRVQILSLNAESFGVIDAQQLQQVDQLTAQIKNVLASNRNSQ
jgi:hypothetical protein